MNVLIDTNILLDYIQHREYFSLSEQILTLCAKKEIYGFIAAHSVPNMFYLLRKDFSDAERRKILLSLTELLPVVGIDHAKIEGALRNNTFSDFEDCLQVECAKEINAAFIITRNAKDFLESEIAVITPEDFLKKLE